MVLLSFACSPDDEWKTEQRDPILESVFRYQFEHNASGRKTTAAAYCLAVVGEDGSEGAPSAELLGRFAVHNPPVHPISSCRTDLSAAHDKASGGYALVFFAGPIRWSSKRRVELEGGYYEANLSASRNRYTLVLEDRQWMVVKDVLEVIS